MLRFILAGDPVEGSLSPKLHRAFFESVNVDGRYSVRRVDEQGLASLVEDMRSGTLDGLNVTRPHKSIAYGLCDEVGEDAAAARSVNTLVMSDGTLRGVSTDAWAIRQLLLAMPSGPVLVLGSGGAAAAASAATDDRQVMVAARDPDQALRFAETFECEPVPWGQGRPAIVINATPLGSFGEELPPGMMAEATGLIDLAYGPDHTRAVRTAATRRIPHADGRQVLALQGAMSFSLWSGIEVDAGIGLAAISTLKVASDGAED